MPAEDGAELRDALKALQDARTGGDAHRAETALERALLSASAVAIDSDKATVAAAVRLLRPADDNGTTRLEVRDQANDQTPLVRGQRERGHELGGPVTDRRDSAVGKTPRALRGARTVRRSRVFPGARGVFCCAYRPAFTSSLNAFSCAACARSCAAWRRSWAAWRCTWRASPPSAGALVAAFGVEPAGAVPSCPLGVDDNCLGRPGDRDAGDAGEESGGLGAGGADPDLRAWPATPVLAMSMLLAPVVSFEPAAFPPRRSTRPWCLPAARWCPPPYSSRRCCDSAR